MKELNRILVDVYKKKFPKKKFIPGETWIPVAGKLFNEQEILNGVDAVLDGWWTEGKWSKILESKLAKYVGVEYCSLVNSGSSANLLAFAALTSPLLKDRKINPGDEVISLAVSFPTTVNPIILYGCIPVFLDIDISTLEIDCSKLEKAYSPKVKAVFIAHTLGNVFNVKEIKKFCNKHNLWLIEDNCDALGSKYDGKMTGSFGDISTLSFYPAHHMTTAEGGAVLTKNALLHKIIKSFRDWGRDCWCPTGMNNTCKSRFGWKCGLLPDGYDHKYIYSHIGYNLKMTDLQASIGVAQFNKLHKFNKKRKENYDKLKETLSCFSDVIDFVSPTENSEPNWFGFVMTIKKKTKFSRSDFLKYLNEKKIDSRLVFAGNITKQPYFINNKIKYRVVGSLANSDTVMERSFWIGLCPLINDKMIKYIHNVFTDFLLKYSI